MCSGQCRKAGNANRTGKLGKKTAGAKKSAKEEHWEKECREEKHREEKRRKKEYRKKGYSRILNDAILKEAKNRGFTTIYLKTDLKNYYEKFGAIFIKKLKTGETLYKFEL